MMLDGGLVLSLFIPGRARTKGSLDADAVRDGAGELTGRVYVKDKPHSARWRRAVVAAVANYRGIELRRIRQAEPMTGQAVRVELAFWFLRPASNRDPLPTTITIGDIDKLQRNVLDALTDAKVYLDDSYVIEVRAFKAWSPDGRTEGVGLSVWSVIEAGG